MNRRDILSLPAFALGIYADPVAIGGVSSRVFNIFEYGAKPDGKTINTSPIQRCIEAAYRSGGGVVYVPPGIFLTGGIMLRSRVILHLEAGATLRGSADINDYPVHAGPTGEVDTTNRHLIFARDAEDLGIRGLGVIDGQGPTFWTSANRVKPAAEDLWKDYFTLGWKPNTQQRPSPMVDFLYCKNVSIEGVTLSNSPSWDLRFTGCDSVFVRRLRVRNPHYGPNSDGVDICCSKNVFLSDCDIECADDAICLKSENPYGEVLPTKNIVITNCIVNTGCNAFKMGTATQGAFENIVFSNSVIYNNDVPLNERAIAGIAIEMVDGGSVDGVMISNIRMQNVRTPIFVRLARRRGGATTSLRNVMIDGVDASGSILTSSITGIPGSRVKDVTLQNIRIRSAEEGRAEWAKLAIPDNERDYPEARMFGRLPAYGLYVRHADQIRLHNVELIAEGPEERSAVVCDDVSDIHISGLEARVAKSTEPVITLRDTSQAFIHGSRVPRTSSVFVRVSGHASSDIVLVGNDLGKNTQAIQLSEEVNPAIISDVAPQ